MSLIPSGTKTNHKKGIANAKRDQKRMEADERQVQHALLSTEQKIKKLKDRGCTRGKEWDRLQRNFQAENA